MQKEVLFILLTLIGLNVFCFGQQPTYTPKHFVAFKDTTEFKPIRPPINGFSSVYLEVDRVEIWDVDDDNTRQVTGWAPALVCIEGNFKDGKKSDVFKAYLIDSFDHSKRYRIWEQSYRDDKLNGEWRTFNLKGTLVKIATYSNDSLHGISRRYARDGKGIEEEREYINGSNIYIDRSYFHQEK